MSTAPIRMGAPKDSMEPKKVLPEGRYTVRLDGFKPKMSKNKDNPSVNFYPVLSVTNHPQFNGEKIRTPLNQTAGFILKAFSHMFGHDLEEQSDGSFALPGGFIPDQADPNNIEKFRYPGQLQGAVGELTLAVGKQTQGANIGKDQNFIKQYHCRVPGCKEKHPTELT